jgi:hypothetical protein
MKGSREEKTGLIVCARGILNTLCMSAKRSINIVVIRCRDDVILFHPSA